MARYDFSSRYVVEDCRSISISWLKKHGYFKGAWYTGEIKWTSGYGEDLGSAGFSTDLCEGRGSLTFQYVYTNTSNGEKESLKYPVYLVSTPCNYGGRRWWFICTFSKNGTYCGRRVGALYLVPEGKYFACRHCYNLTYKSCQESHRFDRMYAQIAMDAGVTPAMVKMTLKEKFKRNP